ncbi:syntaxin-132 isoform X1 [Cinnamomum micranthum f. kanehirae]|uniref:Syntaxin-132 isoform X1 n=1 Tax=Cinnamomum micranthum f. kanehirae TaxID=337451 RepID=A0A3S3N9R3_9MAGN|nr:syntaxin-132 isoform X1 [Cinnamomum micranthum f. kanehirae]
MYGWFHNQAEVAAVFCNLAFHIAGSVTELKPPSSTTSDIGSGISGKDIFQLQSASSWSKFEVQDSFVRDIELGNQVSTDKSVLGMETFSKQVREVEKQMDKLLVQVKKLQEANEESKSVTKASAMKGIKYGIILYKYYATMVVQSSK